MAVSICYLVSLYDMQDEEKTESTSDKIRALEGKKIAKNSG
jgi:hypothetical protein